MTSIANIPNEILHIIFANLGPGDLKTTRLVCQLWSLLATKKLFERVFVSNRPKDLEVFRCISEHELCQKAVKRILYDASTTRISFTWSQRRYCKELVRQWGDLVKSSDELSISRLKAVQASMLGGPWLYDGHSPNYVFSRNQITYYIIGEDEIDKGRSAYKKLAWEEKSMRQQGKLEKKITSGLRNLSSLEEVIISGTLHHKSPFCRSWPLIYLFPGPDDPTPPKFVPGHRYETSKKHLHCHQPLVRALASSGRKIQKLTMDNVRNYLLSTDFFDVNHEIDPNITTIWCMLDAYSSLKTLSLELKCTRKGEDFEKVEWVRLQMPHLTTLSLSGDVSTNYHHAVLFPLQLFRAWSCPNLRHLLIKDVTATKDQLVGAVREHPLLESFTLGRLNVFEGSWESTLDSWRILSPKPRYAISRIPEVDYGCERNAFSFSPQCGHSDENAGSCEVLRDRTESYLNSSSGGIHPIDQARMHFWNRKSAHEIDCPISR